MADIKKEIGQEEGQEVEIKVEVIKPEEVKTEPVKEVKKKEVKTEEKKVEEVKKEEVKEEVKTETSEYADMKERLRVLEESNKVQADLLSAERIKNTIMEKVQDKELQKTIMETGLVKNVEDIDRVMKIVELSKTLNKGTNHSDGFIPQDEVQADAYSQAQKKGDILGMIKQKMSKK